MRNRADSMNRDQGAIYGCAPDARDEYTHADAHHAVAA
jgi:hypothetical protein